jgi:hypothetical protein
MHVYPKLDEIIELSYTLIIRVHVLEYEPDVSP